MGSRWKGRRWSSSGSERERKEWEKSARERLLAKLSGGESPAAAREIKCPDCGSDNLKSAGYGDRLMCIRCSRIFT